MELGFLLQQRQKMSQSQIQFLKILALNSIELEQLLQKYTVNPLLDKNDCSGSEPLTAYYETATSAIFSAEDEKKRQDLSAPASSNIREYLLSQLDLRLYSDKMWALLSYMADCQDDNGFFKVPPEEVAAHNHVPVTLVSKCLRNLQL